MVIFLHAIMVYFTLLYYNMYRHKWFMVSALKLNTVCCLFHNLCSSMIMSSCSFRARARAVGVLMNSVASRSSFSSACLRTSAMTCASVYVGLASLVYVSARVIPILPIACSLSASLTMWRTRA